MLGDDPLFLPTRNLVFYLRQLAAVEHGFFDALALLLAVVVEQAEGVATQEDDGHEVAGGEEGHEEIDDVPHHFEAGQRTEHYHDTAGKDTVDGHSELRVKS